MAALSVASGTRAGTPAPRNLLAFTMEVMIAIVSGLPRSGTSLMMQMLAAGGMPILSDGERRADVDNPRGYLEWERIKQLPKDPACIAEAEGKAVKVISQLLLSLPAQHEYRVIFMQRPLPEIMASQDEMLRRRGNFDPSEDNSAVARAFQDHLSDVYAWLNGKPHVKVSRVQYHAVLREPKETAENVARFLGVQLNVEAMAQQVDGALYRQRKK
jgi:Sulfotransferase domain